MCWGNLGDPVGIESDQLVYDYLSRVGDIAQRHTLTSGDRMRLVTRLRTEIERRRAAEGADTPAAVQRILDGLGTPSEAVADASASSGAPSEAARARRVPAQRREGGPVRFPDAGAPPHLATEEELRAPGRGGETADWWRVEAVPSGPGERVHGFVGGIEIPEMLRPPPSEAAVERVPEDEPASDEGEAAGRGGRRGLSMSPVLLLVVVLLLVGAVLGNWMVVGAGWALAYVTRRLSQNESKWAVMIVPGAVAVGGVVWLWGRSKGRWGAPIPQGALGPALAETWPVVLRVAAVASAAYVLWRARRLG